MAMQFYREEYQRLHPNAVAPCYTAGQGGGQDTIE